MKAEMHVVIFHTLTFVTQIEKLFRFYVPYSRDLNLSSCHMAQNSGGYRQRPMCFSL